jgi:hypothetical protein
LVKFMDVAVAGKYGNDLTNFPVLSPRRYVVP